MRFHKFLFLFCFLKFRRTTNNVSSLKNDKTKRKDNKRYRLQIDNHNNDDGDTNEIT